MFATLKKEPSKGLLKAVAEGSCFFIPYEVRLKEGLHEGQELTQEEFEALYEKSMLCQCHDKALGFLARREHSKSELRLKLARSDFDSKIIAQTLDSLIKEGALDEKRFCREFVLSKVRHKPMGRFLMEKLLESKGVSKETAREALDEIYTPSFSSELEKRARIKLEKKTNDEIQIKEALFKAGFGSDSNYYYN